MKPTLCWLDFGGGSNGTDWKLHWHNWESLCFPKAMGRMGFRDLKCFNQAMLVKQCWRLHDDLNSLLATMLKARYFKNSEFLNAYCGFDPRYSWRSIWGSKSLLMEGLCWRVDNEMSIKVWEDSWLQDEGGSSAPTVAAHADMEIRVATLIDYDAERWNEALLRSTFDVVDVAKILDIPLSKIWPCDSRIWWPNKNGVIGWVCWAKIEHGN